MKVNIMPCRYPLKPTEWPLLLQEGIERHGDKTRISQSVDASDVHVFWGLRRRWGRQAIQEGKKSLVIERAYLGDRFKWHSMGFDGLNGKANFCNGNVPDDRWVKYWKESVKPWKAGGDYALVIGQVPGDSALNGLNIYTWAAETVLKALEHYDRVIFRPHPLDKNKHHVGGAEYSTRTLEEDLKDAAVVITYNSNTAVDAVMNGVPAIAMDKGSMAWQVASHAIGEPLYTGDRDDWGRKIAYAQWLPDEIQSGEAWEHLRGFVNG